MSATLVLLLVEDDRDLAGLLERVLRDEGFSVVWAPDGQRGLHLGLTRTFDAIVLDRGLPAIEGLDLLTKLRSRGVTAPALVLSARGAVRDRIEGLNAGAEDYLAKPFEVAELVARLRALLRRQHERPAILGLPGGSLDPATRTARIAEKDIELSETETALLAALASHPRQVFSRTQLLAQVFGDAETENAVDTYVHYCRRKLGRGVIATVRGLGYRLGSG